MNIKTQSLIKTKKEISIKNLVITGEQNYSKTSIVVWGSNLSFNVGYFKFISFVAPLVELLLQNLRIFIGLLLSDAWLLFF
jgi:hypothetical protein